MPEESYSTEFVFPVAIVLVVLLVLWKQYTAPPPPPPQAYYPEPGPENPPPPRPQQADRDLTEEITVRVLLPGGEAHTCTLPAGARVEELKRRAFPQNSENVVLVFMGRRLPDSARLCDYNISSSAVLHAQRLSGVPNPPSPDTSSPLAFIFSSLFLLGVWLLLLTHPELVDTASRICLIILTAVWALFAKEWVRR